MRNRTVPTFIISLFVITTISGCLDDGSSASTASALEHQSVADRRAAQWEDDAVLVAVVGYEPARGLGEAPEEEYELAESENGSMEPEDPEDPHAGHNHSNPPSEPARPEMDETIHMHDQDEQLRAHALMHRTDYRAGDGRAQAWLYQYRSESNETGQPYNVIVGAGGRVKEAWWGDTSLVPLGGDSPVGELRVDSDEAARIARQQDEAYAAAVENSGWDGLIALLPFGGKNGSVAWVLLLEDPQDGRDEALAVVDARNGSMLPGLDALLPLVREVGFFSGSLNLFSPQEDHRFALIQDEHEYLRVVIEVPRSMPLSGLTAELVGPNGETDSVSWGTTLGIVSLPTQEIRINAPASGLWTLQMSLDEGVRESYEVTWCTDGMSFLTPPTAEC